MDELLVRLAAAVEQGQAFVQALEAPAGMPNRERFVRELQNVQVGLLRALMTVQDAREALRRPAGVGSGTEGIPVG